MLRGLFDDYKYMDIYLPIHHEYCYLGKQKNSLYFSTSNCEHLWPSPSNLLNCAKCLHNPSKDVADWSVDADFKSLLNFNFFWRGGKSGSVKLVCSWICRYENIMVNLDVQLWELGTQRLHQGLYCQKPSLWILWLTSENSKNIHKENLKINWPPNPSCN